MLDTSKIKSNVTKGIDTLLKKNGEINGLYKQLQNYGDLIIVGGAIRDFAIHAIPRDLDIIINSEISILDEVLDKYKYRRNRFGGYNLEVNGVEIDIWNISSHWAFKNNIYECAFENITKGAFYNLDALAMNLNTYDIDINSFLETVESKTLDLNLDEKYANSNPSPEKNIVRALRLKNTWQLDLSKRVVSYCVNWVEERNLSQEKLSQIEYKHYGNKKINKNDYDLILSK